MREAQGKVPDHSRLLLPPDEGYLGWLSLVYNTADLSTALLRAKFWGWEVPADTHIDELDRLMYESWNDPGEGSPTIPMHPPFLELHLDLFNSSVEAIRCWLLPEQVVSLWDHMGDAPISLPSTDDGDSENEIHETTSLPHPIATVETGERPKPRYDRENRILYVGTEVIKELKKISPNQEPIWCAFEEEEWPPRIDDPIPPKTGIVAKRRLHQTIWSLNNGLDNDKVIRFGGDGTGEGLKWWYV